MNRAMRAAVEVARQFGVDGREPVLLQETNNTVVWLRPEPVVAKVAIRPTSQDDVRLEHAIAVELAGLDAEIARPLAGAVPAVHPSSGFVVTLWDHLDGASRQEVRPGELAASLRRLHMALAGTNVDLPSFRASLVRARAALGDDAFMAALPAHERDFLRHVYDDGMAELDLRSFDERRLHGEPHDGNQLSTAAGLRWIDFESSCTGPLEWDLAFLPAETQERFSDVDRGLLALLGKLTSARVATWCWGRARFPDMRNHGQMHLQLLHASARDKS